MNRGVIVGKFSPLHLGHEWMINEASKRCDELLIVSYSNPEFYGCDTLTRKKWFAARFPKIKTVVLSPNVFALPDNDAPNDVQQHFFAWVLKSIAHYPATTLFCSESWGPACAKVLTEELGHKVEAVILDLERNTVPISATKIREMLDLNRQYLSQEVYASFVKRIVLLGGESTGKSTLAKALAEVYDTTWVHEYGRELYEEKEGKLTREDLISIGHEQVSREERALLKSKKFLFCDTSPLTTSFYELFMFRNSSKELLALSKRKYDGVILCNDDFPFVQDGTRVSEEFRNSQQGQYESIIYECPLFLAKGNLKDRIQNVSLWLNRIYV